MVLKNLEDAAGSIFLLFLFLVASPCFAQQDSTVSTKPKFAAIPLVGYDNSQGVALGLFTSAFYHLNSNDVISPPSQSGIAARFTGNGSKLAVIFSQWYLQEDTYRITAAAGLGNSNFQVYAHPLPGDWFIPFSTDFRMALLRVQRQWFPNFYFGAGFVYSYAETVFEVPNLPDDFTTTKGTYNNISILASFDNRNNVYAPSSGWFIDLNTMLFPTFIGSDNTFTKVKFIANNYHSITEDNILAFRATAEAAVGDVPFQAQTVVGNNDIRGYTNGKFRGDQVYTAQAEWRYFFTPKVGTVAFFGAAVVNDEGEFSELLPGIGAGARYRVIPEMNINIGIDIAKGKEDWGLYFRISEAF